MDLQTSTKKPATGIPGSTYNASGVELGIPSRELFEAKINTKVKRVQVKLEDLNLDDDENLINLDVVSQFTIVSLGNAISKTIEKVFDSDCDEPSPMQENTFKTLLLMVSKYVLVFEMDGAFYRQIDGKAMRSTVRPLLINILPDQCDDKLVTNSKLDFH